MKNSEFDEQINEELFALLQHFDQRDTELAGAFSALLIAAALIGRKLGMDQQEILKCWSAAYQNDKLTAGSVEWATG